jgi:hypothetical protein
VIAKADDALAAATKKVMDRLQDVPKPVSPYAGNTPTMARAIEQSTDGLRGLQDEILQGINDNWGKVQPQGWSKNLDNAMTAWEKGGVKGVAKARLIATDVANAARDFTMLSYPQKKYFDLALAYIYQRDTPSIRTHWERYMLAHLIGGSTTLTPMSCWVWIAKTRCSSTWNQR